MEQSPAPGGGESGPAGPADRDSGDILAHCWLWRFLRFHTGLFMILGPDRLEIP